MAETIIQLLEWSLQQTEFAVEQLNFCLGHQQHQQIFLLLKQSKGKTIFFRTRWPADVIAFEFVVDSVSNHT